MKKKLPIGVEHFGQIITDNFYYIDKTNLIADLYQRWGKVQLFTRPRRFGKSLNMSMLKSFFEIDTDPSLFEGLKISESEKICSEWMGNYPVISITLKDCGGLTYSAACAALKNEVGREANRFAFLKDSKILSSDEKNIYQSLLQMDRGVFVMSDFLLENSLKTLTMLLEKHYHKQVILLIDEYDVPLDKAFQNGYYDEMVSLIRNMFSLALKTNSSLYFSVLTGCLRISKESIFTGLNNLRINNITDTAYSEYFGFTEKEVHALLQYYELEDCADIIRSWYNGYHFGETSIYCPWDVLNYCDALLENRLAPPKNYWANSSGNSMIRRFIDKADSTTKQEIEQLISGNTIWKKINFELTYNELDRTINHLWSVLFTTGYLTYQTMREGDMLELSIPNQEMRSLFVSQIQEWFQDTAHEDTEKLEKLCNALINGNADLLEDIINDYLWEGISIRDTAVQNKYKENFYHGMIFGLLQYRTRWIIRSNEETGFGYSDLLIETPERIGIILEFKYASSVDTLEKESLAALSQIEELRYEARLKSDGMKKILKYGIAFYLKNCKVTMK